MKVRAVWVCFISSVITFLDLPYGLTAEETLIVVSSSSSHMSLSGQYRPLDENDLGPSNYNVIAQIQSPNVADHPLIHIPISWLRSPDLSALRATL